MHGTTKKCNNYGKCSDFYIEEIKMRVVQRALAVLLILNSILFGMPMVQAASTTANAAVAAEEPGYTISVISHERVPLAEIETDEPVMVIAYVMRYFLPTVIVIVAAVYAVRLQRIKRRIDELGGSEELL